MLLSHSLRLRLLRLHLLLIFARLLINEAECVLHIWVVRVAHCRRIKHIIPSTLFQTLIKLLLNGEVLLMDLIFDLLNWSFASGVYIESSIQIVQLSKALVCH